MKIDKRVFKFFKSREIEGVIKTLMVKRDAVGDFYVIFVCEAGQRQISTVRTDKNVGCDFGLKRFLTSSNGDDVDSPLFLHKMMRHVRKLGRNLSKKAKRSANRERTRLALAREHRHIAACRSDFLWKLALEMARKYDVVCL